MIINNQAKSRVKNIQDFIPFKLERLRLSFCLKFLKFQFSCLKFVLGYVLLNGLRVKNNSMEGWPSG